jgi:acetylglutamate kinase
MSTYVIKLGGALCLEKDTLDALAAGLLRLRAAGHRPVVVHGGGPQIDAALAALGEPILKHHRLRRPSMDAVRIVRRELDSIGARIAHALAQRGIPAQHVPSEEQILQARVKELPDGFDLGRVGTFEGFDAARVLTHSDVFQAKQAASEDAETNAGSSVPVVSPVGFDSVGPLNINADEAAAAIAAALTLATTPDARALSVFDGARLTMRSGSASSVTRLPASSVRVIGYAASGVGSVGGVTGGDAIGPWVAPGEAHAAASRATRTRDERARRVMLMPFPFTRGW